jgi:hypothetical protein
MSGTTQCELGYCGHDTSTCRQTSLMAAVAVLEPDTSCDVSWCAAEAAHAMLRYCKTCWEMAPGVALCDAHSIDSWHDVRADDYATRCEHCGGKALIADTAPIPAQEARR